MKIFITGGSGLIGSNIIKTLSRYHEFLCLKNKTDLPEIRNLNSVTGDICDSDLEKFVEQCDFVIHAGAQYKIGDVNESEMRHVNVDGTENILGIANKLKKPTIYFSTTAALEEDGSIKKDSKSPYEMTKAEAHKIALEYAEKMKLSIICPSGVLGSGTDILGRFMRDYINKKLKYIACPDAKLSLVHVDDVVKAVKILLDAKPGVFICSAYSMKLMEFVDAIENITNIPKPKKIISEKKAKILSRLVGKKEEIDFITNQGFFSSDRLKILGWDPMPIDKAIEKALENFSSYRSAYLMHN